eukprot:1147330-Pelagomonas_calceolata.AAC.3
MSSSTSQHACGFFRVRASALLHYPMQQPLAQYLQAWPLWAGQYYDFVSSWYHAVLHATTDKLCGIE